MIVNEIHSNVWGFLLITMGAALAILKHENVGTTLIATGSVLLKQNADIKEEPK